MDPSPRVRRDRFAPQRVEHARERRELRRRARRRDVSQVRRVRFAVVRRRARAAAGPARRARRARSRRDPARRRRARRRARGRARRRHRVSLSGVPSGAVSKRASHCLRI